MNGRSSPPALPGSKRCSATTSTPRSAQPCPPGPPPTPAHSDPAIHSTTPRRPTLSARSSLPASLAASSNDAAPPASWPTRSRSLTGHRAPQTGGVSWTTWLTSRRTTTRKLQSRDRCRSAEHPRSRHVYAQARPHRRVLQHACAPLHAPAIWLDARGCAHRSSRRTIRLPTQRALDSQADPHTLCPLPTARHRRHHVP